MKRVRDWLSSYSSVEQKTSTLRDKLGALDARVFDVRKELKNDEIQPGKKPREEVHHWLTAVQVKKDEVESKFKDGQGKGSSSSSHDTAFLDRSIEEIDELIQRGKFSDDTRLPLLVEKKLVGQKIQQNTEKILEWLQNHKHNIIGVYGMGGVGKTTLLTQIHNLLLQHSNVYGRVYWVTVSQNCSEHKLQERIAKALGVNCLGDDDGRIRAAILHNKLAANGPTVFILDDMWESFWGNEVGIPLEGSSCKIILSTRSVEVCRKMGCKEEFVIKAEILTEIEAWDLFVDKLGHYDTLSLEAKEIAGYVAKECGGLPLAIATVARSMSGIVDTYDWQNALTELKSVCGQGDMNDDVFRILQYSYDRLNDKMVQHCFLSCILYSEDEVISRETLIDLWMNEGLLDERGSRKQQVVKGHAILNRLENWCLLESTLDWRKQKCVKVHDLIRDMAIKITKNHPCFMAFSGLYMRNLPEEKQWRKDLVKVSLSHNGIEEIRCDMAPFTPHLTVLMLNGNDSLKRIPESFFKHMTALTVVDLSYTKIERLPESVSDLVNLRALLLQFCTELTYVPSLEKLSELRVLDLEWDEQLKEAPKGIERLKCLEKVSFCPWHVSNISGFNKLIESSPALISYRFLLHDFPIVKSPFHFKLSVFILHRFYLYEEVVCLTGVQYGEDKAIPLIPTSVQSLGLIDCRGLEYISSSSSSLGLHTLKELLLIGLPDLRRIIKSGGCSFSHLCELTIEGCPKIKVVLPLTVDQLCLPNLTYISVSDCEEVEEIFESNHSIEPNPILTFPNLYSISLIDLPKLGRIYRGLLICVSLMSYEVCECPKLELLPLSRPLKHDRSLKSMGCKSECWEMFRKSNPLICDGSPSTLASIANNTELWEMLHRKYPEDARILSYHINQPPPIKYIHH